MVFLFRAQSVTQLGGISLKNLNPPNKSDNFMTSMWGVYPEAIACNIDGLCSEITKVENWSKVQFSPKDNTQNVSFMAVIDKELLAFASTL